MNDFGPIERALAIRAIERALEEEDIEKQKRKNWKKAQKIMKQYPNWFKS